MKTFSCRHCQKDFDNKRKLAGHSTWCESNPKRAETLLKLESNRKAASEAATLLTLRKCKWCSLEFEMTGSQIQNHIRWCEQNPRSSDDRQKQAERCASIRGIHTPEGIEKMKASLRAAHSRGAYEASYIAKKGKPGWKPNDEERHLLSEKRKDFLKRNPDKHPWKRHDKFKSIPCELLKKRLTQECLNFVEEHQPLQDRFFAIDIAFPESKLGIEINGQQHYNKDGTLKKYYQERHDLIEQQGWKIIEYHYSKCKEPFITHLIDGIKFHLRYSSESIWGCQTITR